MAAVANIIEVSNAVTVDGVLSAIASPPFVKAAVGLNSLYREDIPVGLNTNVKKFRKNGSLTAATLAQSTALAPDSNGELTDTSVSATSAKCAVVSGISLEAETFTYLDANRVMNEQGAAIGRFVSNDILSLAGGLSVTQTATGYATIDDFYMGQFSIFNSNCPNQEVPLHAIIGPQAYRSVRKEMAQTGATPWSNPMMLQILAGLPSDGGYVGTIPGLADFYVTTGFSTSGGDDQQLLIHPQWAFAGIFATAPIFWVAKKGAEGFYTEVAAAFLYDVVEWNDLAGVNIKSDT